MSKYALATSMFEDLPEGLRNLLGTPLGTFTTLVEPTTEEQANILAGQFLAQFQNNILVPLSGLPLVSMMMYVGSLNPALVAGLFAGLEALEGGGPFDVIAPKDGGIYPGFFDAWTVRAPNVESITVTVGEGDDAESFDLDRNDDIWSAKWPMPIGTHTAVFSDGSQSMSVSFSVVSYEILEPIVTPIDSETKEVEFRYEIPEGIAETGEITVTYNMNTWNFILGVTGTIAAGIAILPVSATVATVAGVIVVATGAQLVINEYVANL